MAKQTGGITLKGEEKTLYTSENKGNNKSSTKPGYKNGDKRRSHQGTAQPKRAQKNDNRSSQGKRFEGNCYNRGKKGHMSKDCWSKKKFGKNNMAFSNMEMEEEWDTEVLYVIEEDELAFMVTMGDHINYVNDWIVDSRCSNHMTGDQSKLQDKKKYKGNHMVRTRNNAQLSIAQICNRIIMPGNKSNTVSLHNVYHVPGIKKNLL